MKNQTLSSNTLKNLFSEISEYKDPERAKHSQVFFKTGKGEYAEGDMFLGLSVPVQRMLAQKYINLSQRDIIVLLQSRIHEHRLIALLILTYQFKKKTGNKKEIYDMYMQNIRFVNNWDLVDASCYKIVGEYLKNSNKSILYTLAQSKNIWKRRIAIVSTLTFIKESHLNDTYAIALILLPSKEDLIHKAVGWMLREAGKKDKVRLERFLEKNIKSIPRTTLRYAIEKWSEEERKKYLEM